MDVNYQELREYLKRIEKNSLLAAKNVLTIDDVALLTDLSKSWLYKATCNRLIPHYKPNKQIYFDRVELEEWMKQNRIATTEEINNEATKYITRKGAPR